MGSWTSTEGRLATVTVTTTKTSVTSKTKVQVKAFKRVGTNNLDTVTETCICDIGLDSGKKASLANDFDITNQAKIESSGGLDYQIRIFPEDGKSEPEVFQIVYDAETYQHFPVVRLLDVRTAMVPTAVNAGYAGNPMVPTVGNAGYMGNSLVRSASPPCPKMNDEERLKALGNEIRTTLAKLNAEGQSKETVEQLKLELIAILQAGDESGTDFQECFEESGEDGMLSEAMRAPQAKKTMSEISGAYYNRPPDEWWSEASMTRVGLAVTSQVMDARLFHKPSRSPAPWSEGQSMTLYEEMGMCDPTKSYIAVWMLLGNVAVLTVSEVVSPELFNQLLANKLQTCLDSRLKLVIDPIEVSSSCRTMLPTSATDPQEADFATGFLGKKGSSIYRGKLPNGADHLSLMIDFNCSGMLIAYAIKKVGFAQGHVLDLHVVDFPGNACLASGRLKVTSEVKKLM